MTEWKTADRPLAGSQTALRPLDKKTSANCSHNSGKKSVGRATSGDEEGPATGAEGSLDGDEVASELPCGCEGEAPDLPVLLEEDSDLARGALRGEGLVRPATSMEA